jgi:hypothetical protein
MEPKPGELYPTQVASYAEACCHDLINKSNSPGDILLASLVRLGQITGKISVAFPRDGITFDLDGRNEMLWKCLERELEDSRKNLPVQISQHSESIHLPPNFV